MTFDAWFATNFVGYQNEVEDGSYLAIEYKREMKSVWDYQQNKIDTLISHINEALDGFEDGEFNYCHKQLMKALGDKT